MRRSAMFNVLFRRQGSNSRLLVIVGAQKCGTTTLHKSLASHPGVRTPHATDGTPIKELDFFNKHWGEGVSWFDGHFPGESGPRLESTPNYLCELRSLERLASAFPNARLLVSLRNPVARAYSAYNHYVQESHQTYEWDWLEPGASFAANVEAELAAHDPAEPSTFGLLGRGRYSVQIANLLRLFPRNQVRIELLERWSRKPRALHGQLLQDLGVHPWRLPVRRAHQRQMTVESMTSDSRAKLHEHFRIYNQELEELLGQSIPELY